MLRENSLSIDIGHDKIKIVEGKYNGKNIIIRNTFEIDTPGGSFASGDILNEELLANAIVNKLDEKKIKAKGAIITVNTHEVITREIILPEVKNGDMDSMIRFEIQDYIPIVFEDYVLEHKIIEKIEEAGVKKNRIFVAAMPKHIVETYLKFINKIDLKPLAMDMDENVIWKLFSKELTINESVYDTQSTVAFIDIGHEMIKTHIISNSNLEFSRSINFGVKDLIDSNSEKFNMTKEEVIEHFKKEIDITEDETSMLDFNMMMMNQNTRDYVNTWIQQLETVIRYFVSKKTGNKIDQIYLYGGGAELKNIDKYFTENINIPTEKIESIAKIKFSKEEKNKSESEKAEYLRKNLNAISALIRL